MSKKIIVISLVLVFAFAFSMFFACFVFTPTVNMNLMYDDFDYAFYASRTEGTVNETNYTQDIISVARFSRFTPPIPERPNYRFNGWYRDVGYTVAWINGDIIDHDITLYAKWEEI